jgi:glycosyltransferase involved in cell wall biosynthesis
MPRGIDDMANEDRGPGISIFFPAFNDAQSIGSLVKTAFEILPTLTADYEVIVVNDGSTDATSVVLEALARSHPQLRIVEHPQNRGYGAALRSGFQHATKELVFYTDGDGQYDVRELSTLHAGLAPGVDVVNGYKVQRADSVHREMLGGLYNRLARSLFRLPIRDVDCDFRLLRRSALERVELNSSSGAICVELVRKLSSGGAIFAEVPVNHYPRVHGRSQFFTPRRIALTAFDFSLLWLRLVLLRPLISRN